MADCDHFSGRLRDVRKYGLPVTRSYSLMSERPSFFLRFAADVVRASGYEVPSDLRGFARTAPHVTVERAGPTDYRLRGARR